MRCRPEDRKDVYGVAYPARGTADDYVDDWMLTIAQHLGAWLYRRADGNVGLALVGALVVTPPLAVTWAVARAALDSVYATGPIRIPVARAIRR